MRVQQCQLAANTYEPVVEASNPSTNSLRSPWRTVLHHLVSYNGWVVSAADPWKTLYRWRAPVGDDGRGSGFFCLVKFADTRVVARSRSCRPWRVLVAGWNSIASRRAVTGRDRSSVTQLCHGLLISFLLCSISSGPFPLLCPPCSSSFFSILRFLLLSLFDYPYSHKIYSNTYINRATQIEEWIKLALSDHDWISTILFIFKRKQIADSVMRLMEYVYNRARQMS